MNLFEKYGGTAAVSLIVNSFYKRIMAKPNLRRYYQNTNMATLATCMAEFISHLLGKSTREYEKDYLKSKHAHLSITNASFHQVAQTLRHELMEAGFEPQDVDQVMATVWASRSDIVTKK